MLSTKTLMTYNLPFLQSFWIHFYPVLVQESQIPVLDEDSTLPTVVNFRRTLKDESLVPLSLDDWHEQRKPSLRNQVPTTRPSSRASSNELQSIDPFDANNIAYESTASHKYQFADSDSDSQEGFALPALKRDDNFNERGNGFSDNDQQDDDGFDDGDGGEQDKHDSNDNGQGEPGGFAILGAQASYLQQPRNQRKYPLQEKLGTLRQSWELKLRHGMFNKFMDLISIPAPPRAQR
ncbi:hypothetical protein AAF712_014169 [Marasmius tenuissimus]|uniref:Uncharacterized protein n=1 Tax=Marasmius tenuissimus TaxID=585030 RepID=A0ABR2ZCX1_9AGAR